jgi:glutamine synthetase
MFGYSLQRAARNKEFVRDVLEKLRDFNIPIEGMHTETGPGVFEVAIRYSDALEAADNAVLFKMGIKDIAADYGIIPTFMAKPSSKLPGE